MANAAWMAISNARAFKTGSAPGCPRHTGQTFVLGGAPNPVAQPQKILVRVLSWTCTSSPITGSYFAISSGVASAETPDAMPDYLAGGLVFAAGADSASVRRSARSFTLRLILLLRCRP